MNRSNPLVAGFCEAMKPPGPMAEAQILVTEAAKDMADESRPERDRFNSAIRLLCSIPAISDRLPESAQNEIFGRAGVMPESAI